MLFIPDLPEADSPFPLHGDPIFCSAKKNKRIEKIVPKTVKIIEDFFKHNPDFIKPHYTMMIVGVPNVGQYPMRTCTFNNLITKKECRSISDSSTGFLTLSEFREIVCNKRRQRKLHWPYKHGHESGLSTGSYEKCFADHPGIATSQNLLGRFSRLASKGRLRLSDHFIKILDFSVHSSNEIIPL